MVDANKQEDSKQENSKSVQPETAKPASEKEYMSLLETCQSVLWAMLGVQNKKNARRDFSRGKPSHFIIIGILFAVVFVLVLATLVKTILGEVIT